MYYSDSPPLVSSGWFTQSSPNSLVPFLWPNPKDTTHPLPWPHSQGTSVTICTKLEGRERELLSWPKGDISDLYTGAVTLDSLSLVLPVILTKMRDYFPLCTLDLLGKNCSPIKTLSLSINSFDYVKSQRVLVKTFLGFMGTQGFSVTRWNVSLFIHFHS